jgi:hypothetical protein
MSQLNVDKLSQLDIGSMSVEDLSNIKSSILRDTLIEISELEENELLLQTHQNHTSHASHSTHSNSVQPMKPPILD